jgi:cyclohexyl-isocyanide hydratase
MNRLNIGILIYPKVDQMDVTGPFEVFSRMPNTEVHVIGTDPNAIRDARGLILTPQVTLADAPPLDLLQVPGGPGQEDLMEDERVLSFIREQMSSSRYVFSVCTGALICGAAGILRNRRATTHWSVFDLLPYFGAIPVDSRVVVDGNFISAAGVSAGIDGAITIASILRGDGVAQQIQIKMEYVPDPPFDAGSPKTAPPQVREAVLEDYRQLTAARAVTASRIAARLGIRIPE